MIRAILAIISVSILSFHIGRFVEYQAHVSSIQIADGVTEIAAVMIENEIKVLGE